MALTKVDISLMQNTGTTANKLLAYDGSGNLPAVDGSQITNVATGILESTSDPTISTNPSGGVGTQWNNKTSGEVYICTDATAGANVWTNVGAGSGNILPWNVQGSNYGYYIGGNPSASNRIGKWSLSSDSNGTDVGDMLYGAQGMCGGKSTSYGYGAGGEPSRVDINKFPFASDSNATDVGDLTVGRAFWNNSCSSSSHIYNYGGEGGGNSYRNVIDKHPNATDSNATDVGDLAMGRNQGATCFTLTHGYNAGGYTGTHNNQIERNAFASDGNSVDTTQNLFESIYNNSGSSSTTHGYSSAGHTSGWTNTIQKFQFDSSNNGTDVGNLLTATGGSTASSATAYGYEIGGYPGNTNVIEKFSFTTDGNSVDVADLDAGIANGGGTEY